MELKKDFIILGADNSLRCTGWSVVKVTNYKEKNQKLELLDYGYIDTNQITFEQAIVLIEKIFTNVVKQYKPDYISAEAPFSGKNAQTLITLSNIHGAMLLVAAKAKVPVTYYSVMTMKSQVVGKMKTKKDDGTKKTGKEMKQEVADKVIEIFGRQSFIKDYTDDVTDSISAIITFLNMEGETPKTLKATQKKITKKTTNKKTK